MQAMVLTSLRGPLEWREMPDPDPAPGEIRIRVASHEVCAEAGVVVEAHADLGGAVHHMAVGEEIAVRREQETRAGAAARAACAAVGLARQAALLDSHVSTLGELSGPVADRVRELRRALGIDASDEAPPFVLGDGTPVDASDLRFRRMASLTALSLETNGGMCRDLLRVRYEEEEIAV